MNPNSPADLRFGQRTTLTGQPGLDLASLDTHELPNGCVVLVNQAPLSPDLFVFEKGATGAADGVNIIAPVNGGGLWFRYTFLSGVAELDQFAVTFVPNPILATTIGDSTNALINRQVPGKVQVQAQLNLSTTAVVPEIVTVQGMVDGAPSGPIASFVLGALAETFSLAFLATFAATGAHTLGLRVTAGATGNVTVANANLFTLGQV